MWYGSGREEWIEASAGGPTSLLATFTHSLDLAAAFGIHFRRALGSKRASASFDITRQSAGHSTSGSLC